MYLKNILPFVFLGEDKSKFYALTVGEGIWFDGDIEVVLVCYFTTHSDFSSYVFQVYNSDGRLLEYRSCDESNMTVDSMLVKALYYFNIEPHAWRLYPKKCINDTEFLGKDIERYYRARAAVCDRLYETRVCHKHSRGKTTFGYTRNGLLNTLGWSQEEEDQEITKALID
ncbi:MAG: hypothetical protein KDJ99_27265 [Candidatus Competibacteraceae bacterium]|nr:hypothetical protein [Candidatus Competibacteraceae bacterium]